VLITGEPGVGKEVVAHALHSAGNRRGRPFLAVNCASLPDSLIEHELFGHTRGAFTGASGPKPGLFRAANTGSLLLDEIGEVPLELQAKMLRVLQEKKVRPVGGTDELPIDTRIIAATNRDLLTAVENGTFRADLYSRIEAPYVDVPPLRDRMVDVPLLFAHFLIHHTKEMPSARRLIRPADEHAPLIPMSAIHQLLSHSWPRNVRELGKFVETALIHSADSKRFQLPDWRWETTNSTSSSLVRDVTPTSRVDPSKITEVLLLEVLEQHKFVARQVASHFGISRTTLDKLMRELNIPRPSDLSIDDISQALQQTNQHIDNAAKLLKVSSRGLKQQLRILEIEALE
jgi:two-component system response regulator HydG